MALGESDYGIYTLIAGVVSMLSFVTNSLVTTTQRFISYYQGKKDNAIVKEVLNTSVVTHLILGLFVIAILESFSPILFNGFLNIPVERLSAAHNIYQAVVVMLFLSFITAPYRALLISHENIVYISAVDVLDGVLKVLFAIIITHAVVDKLVLYGYLMTAVQFFNFFALSLFCFLKYKECEFPGFHSLSIKYLKEMTSFAGWSIYSTGCIVGRQQGVAIVLNKCINEVANAAYGIAFQISGYTSFLSSSLANAISPQIIKAEGAGDRLKALNLSVSTCRYMFFLISAVCIPCIFEIDNILDWWLDEVPKDTALFCTMVMITAMIDNLTVGLAYINQAIGKIKAYSIIVNTPKLLILPVSIILLKHGFGLRILSISYIAVEGLSAILRLPYIRKTAKLNVKYYFDVVFKKELLPLLVNLFFCFLFTRMFSFEYRFFITIILSAFLYFITIYLIGLTGQEKLFAKTLVKNLLRRI